MGNIKLLKRIFTATSIVLFVIFSITAYVITFFKNHYDIERATVRDQNMNAIKSLDPGRPGIDRFNLSPKLAHFKKISDLDGALPHQNPATDKIVDDVLGPETNANGNGAGDEGECR